MKRHSRTRTPATLALLAAALLMFSSVQAQESLSPAVANDLLSAYELIENDRHRDALNELNRLIERRGDSMKPFDRASVLQIRGTAYVNLEDYTNALRDFQEVIRLNALPEEQQLRIRFNTAQLLFMTERYAESIELFNEWLQFETEPDANTYFMLAAAYYNLDRPQEALDPITNAIEVSEEPERRYYELKNVLLSELGRDAERIPLMRQMIALWPDEVNFWRQLSSLYAAQGDDLAAFSALESAFHAGLIDSENDLVLLAQYYSTHDNPYRGARLLEREMEAGRVERNVDNLELLSQLWSQAREHDEAIPVLRQAARLSDTGLLSFRLGQSLLASENYEGAEEALLAAIRKGELDSSMLADAWMLLGTARFSQAGPGDRAQRGIAEEAFRRAAQYSRTRAQASNWLQYIDAIDDTETRQAMLEADQTAALEEAARQRMLTSCRAEQLAGNELSEECAELLEGGQQQDEVQPQDEGEPEDEG